MPNEPFDSAAKSDLLVSSQKSLKVEESQGRKVDLPLILWTPGYATAAVASYSAGD